MDKCKFLKPAIPVLAIAVMTFFLSLISYSKDRDDGVKPSFYQSYYEPAIRMSCGQSFGVDASGVITDEMRRFLNNEQQTLSCDSVLEAKTLEKNPPQKGWYHLLLVTSLVWKITGISWPALYGLAAAMLAISAAMIFTMFRFFMPCSIAVILTVLSILPGLKFLPYLRDLNKAPFILTGLLVTVWLVLRSPTRMRLFLVMALLGGWLGIGYGFRPDVLIVLPLLFITIIFFRQAPFKKEFLNGLIASMILFITFVIAASPVLLAVNANVGSCQWHFGLLGLSDIHTGMLGIRPASYSWLAHYDDLQVWRLVESYAQRVFDMHDIGFCTPLYDQVSRSVYLEIFRTFPSDFLIRGIAAAKQVITSGLFSGNQGLILQKIWILLWGITVITLLAWNLRIGLFSIFALAFLCAYPAFQFDLRHYFHLAFLTWLPVGILFGSLIGSLTAAMRKKNYAAGIDFLNPPTISSWLRSIVIFAALLVTFYACYISVDYYQINSLRNMFDAYSHANGVNVNQKSKISQKDSMIMTIPAPSTKNNFKIDGQMLKLNLSGQNCTFGAKKISVVVGGNDPDYFFKKEFILDPRMAKEKAEIFIPIYFEHDRLNTISLILPKEDVGCMWSAMWVNPRELPSAWIMNTFYTNNDKLE